MEQKRMRVEDIPEHLMKKIKILFESNDQVRNLRIKAQMKQRSGDFIEALKINRELEELFTKAISEYIRQAEEEVSQLSLRQAGIPKEDASEVMVRTITLFMAIDIIDSSIMEIDEILHKTDDTLHFEMLNDIRHLSQMAKDKMSLLGKYSSYLNGAYWGDITDDMFAMMRNKAKKIIAKHAKANANAKEDGIWE